MILDLFKLDGQVALVTGGGSGPGRAIAIALAEAGADVAILYRSRFDATRAAITALGRRCLGVQLDLATATVPQLHGAVQQAMNQLGRLDILTNCARVAQRAPTLAYAEKDWDALLRVNLRAAFFLSQAAAAHFRQQHRGKIIHVGSLLSGHAAALDAAHLSSRTGVLGLTQTLAQELAPEGINVNCIIPGYVDAPRCAAITDAEGGQAVLAAIPARRWSSAEDLQGAAVFLASRASDYVHGAAVVVDGGWAVR